MLGAVPRTPDDVVKQLLVGASHAPDKLDFILHDSAVLKRRTCPPVSRQTTTTAGAEVNREHALKDVLYFLIHPQLGGLASQI